MIKYLTRRMAWFFLSALLVAMTAQLAHADVCFIQPLSQDVHSMGFTGQAARAQRFQVAGSQTCTVDAVPAPIMIR